MHALKSLHLQGFKSHDQTRVKLGPLNVLVGPNGAGKSNLLEAIAFLGDIARIDLEAALEKRGGWNSLVFRGSGATTRIAVGLGAVLTEFSSSASPDGYILYLATHPDLGLVRTEEVGFRVSADGNQLIRVAGGHVSGTNHGWTERSGSDSRIWHISEVDRRLSPHSAALAVLPKLGPEDGAVQVGQIADLLMSFRVFDPDVAAARQPSATELHPKLASDARNLAGWLHWLYKTEPETFGWLCDDLRAIVPGVKALHFEPIGGSTEAVKLTIEETALSGRTDLAHASYGTIRALAILAMLHDPNPPKLSCIEEIDHGLHPYALDRIVERLRTASEKTQLILATHSPALVNRLRPEEIIVCERDPETGASRMPAISQEDIKTLLANSGGLGLGELWFSGALGGNP